MFRENQLYPVLGKLFSSLSKSAEKYTAQEQFGIIFSLPLFIGLHWGTGWASLTYSECPALSRLVAHLASELWWRWWLNKIVTLAEPILPLLKIMTEPLSASAVQNEVPQFCLRENMMILWRIPSTSLNTVLSWIQNRSEDECTQ